MLKYIDVIVVAVMLVAGASLVAPEAGGATGNTVGIAVQQPTDPRLLEAQKAEGEFEKLFAAKRFKDALPYARQVLKLREQALGANHPLVGQSCLYLGAVLDEVDDDASAQRAFECALRIAEATIGPDHVDILTILSGLTVALSKQRQIAAAVALHERILHIAEKNYGPDDPRLASELAFSGVVLGIQGQFDTARARLERATQIYEKALGPQHREVGRTRFKLAIVYYDQANYAAARAELEHAMRIFVNAEGPENADVADVLGKLGDIAKQVGDITGAQTLYERSLAMSEKVAETAPDTAASAAGRLGELYQDKGDYVAARRLLERSVAIKEKAYGADHPFVATELNNLAVLLSEQGDYVAARKLDERALNLFEKAYGPVHQKVATSLDNLAMQYSFEGNHAAAEPLERRATEITEKLFGPDHPDVAVRVGNLGLTLAYEGKFEEARPLLERAINIQEKAFGQQNASLAMFVNNLGYYYRVRGDLAAAQRLYERSLRIDEALYGSDHPRVAMRLINLAAVERLQKNYERSQERLLRAAAILDTQSQTVVPTLSLAEQAAFIRANLLPQTERLLQASANPDSIASAYAIFFRWKGLLVESLREQRALNRLAKNPQYRPQLQRLAVLRAQIAGWYLKAGSVPLADWTQQNETLTREKEAIERALAGTETRVATQDPLRAVDLQGFRSLLRGDETLVDIYSDVPVGDVVQSVTHYVAVVTSRGASPVLVDLGAEAAVNNAASRWRSAVLDGRDANTEWQNVVALLRTPLQAALPRATRKVWVSPDGELSRMPWQMVFADGPTDEMLVAQTDSPREILSLRQREKAARRLAQPTLLLAGGIDFDSSKPDSARSARNPAPFAALPSTAREVDALEKLARTAHVAVWSMTGANATKEAVEEKLSSADYAHLATHGFFYAETEAASRARQMATRGADTAALVKDVRNPLVESGLAFAGANVRDPTTLESRGLLTAEELVGFDLARTNLVVLSACDTGRGEQITGQGVMGLRASFVASGARSVVMSLWKVPDEATSRLMQAFYTNLWEKKMPKAAALRDAQRSVRDEPSGKFKAPVHWAGWVLAGEGW